ncbi:MAG: hypothetical protein RIS75_1363 [Actinomycetota bacterium]|jgi:hypothetical protein
MKTDFKVVYKELFSPKAGKFVEVVVPPLKYLMIDGSGNPNTATEYVTAIEALYSISYTLKFFSKKELDRDYVVPPLEGLWWADDMSAFTRGVKDEWKWTMMIMVPEWITDQHVTDALHKVKVKNPDSRTEDVRCEVFDEGLSVQTMHIGSYDSEAPTLHELHNVYMPEHGLEFNGLHHEIYISDPRKTEAAKLKTVLRQPVRKI